MPARVPRCFPYEPVRVRYVTSRLPGCRGTACGAQAWGISGFARVGAGEAQTFGWGGTEAVAATGFLEATFTPAREGEMAVWFQSSNRWGCVSYDSDYGRNFRFTVNRGRAPGHAAPHLELPHAHRRDAPRRVNSDRTGCRAPHRGETERDPRTGAEREVVERREGRGVSHFENCPQADRFRK